MTRAARRATALLLAALTALLLSVALLAGPASAADDGVGGQAAEEEPVHAVAQEAEGFGTGMWDGMMLAAVTGVLLGVAVFGLSSPGEIERDGHHGADPHTPATPEPVAGSVVSPSGMERTDHVDGGRGDQQMAP